MNAKPLKLLLLEDGCKDARFLQKTISDGGSFECELVKMDELKRALSAVNGEPRSFSCVRVIPARNSRQI
jgi:hypothetical protein